MERSQHKHYAYYLLIISHHVKRVPYPHREVVLKMLNKNILVSGHVYCAEYALHRMDFVSVGTEVLRENLSMKSINTALKSI